ncbi:MAG: hypothetical protein EON59_02365 [Alphaproteobacteria bacterium]|nr:MAG: hypothetical protein EON59_02365 [Alphaproteobacteria bacterium]
MCAGALESDFEAGGISILSRVGAGLLGLTTGQSIMWPDRAGKQRPLRIIEVMKGVADAIGDTCRFCALLDALLGHLCQNFAWDRRLGRYPVVGTPCASGTMSNAMLIRSSSSPLGIVQCS